MADVALKEPALRRSVFEGLPLASRAAAACALEPLPPATRLSVRGRPGVAEAAAGALGFPLPTDVCRAAEAGGRAALWLGPDEWLVIAPEAEAATLPAALETALAGVPHAVVDISHRNVALAVSGPAAAYVLNHGCPLDLSLSAFPVGMATRTILGKVEVVLWRTGPDSFRLECWRTFAEWVVAFLNEARREFD
ncbi:sarcosine oxidase subunit gamma [Chthonobacter rhizosphaerae]|uniref:sarcosine oxidase subunit gamma n=1 Tax=Chthonobacter rhizosphaerae TaxID=2735553 RepID=UPI0015EFAD4A|nr:sarcosine oxidase subunit gamma family protein [Chthonobacter rhizosphaerae]